MGAIAFIRKILARLASRRIPVRIQVSSLGITVGSPEKIVFQVEWDEVTQIVCFKRDLYTVDMICMAMSTPRGTLELNEQMAGWTELAHNLHDYLPGSLSYDDWYMFVVFPAFETNNLLIYQKGEIVSMPAR